MAETADPPDRTPIGITLVCLLLVIYSLFWILTWILAGMVGNGVIALVSMIVAAGILLLAYFLYLGSSTAWWITLALIGGSTVWRLSLVTSGEVDNLVNATVGVIILLYLLSQHEFYQSAQTN